MNANPAVEPAARYRAELKCIECGAVYPLTRVIYRCESCDGLLGVEHDLSAVQATSGADWKRIFSDRMSSFAHPWSSGVWGKKEWVLPGVDDADIVTLGEGRTPLVPVPQLARDLELEDLRIKQCGTSHTGSFKDLGMTVLVSHVRSLIRGGEPIRAVACASTGDTSAALAAYASAAGVPTIVFLPAGKISTAQLVQPLSNGSLVLSLDTDFDGCMEIVKAITQDKSIYLANSMNPLRIEGQKTVSFEMCQQLDWEVPDWVIIPGGNLGNVSALGQGFKMLRAAGIIDRFPRICVAQAEHANPLYKSFRDRGLDGFEPVRARRTLASAIQIGNPVSFPRAARTLREFEGVVEQASEGELSEAAARADRCGMFTDPHTGVALASLFKLRASGEIRPGERVVIVSTAHALKFTEFKTAYHDARLEIEDTRYQYRTQPIELAADLDAVRRTLDQKLGATPGA